MLLFVPGMHMHLFPVRSVILHQIFLSFIFQVLLLVLNLLRILFGAPGVGPGPVTLLQLPVGYPKTVMQKFTYTAKHLQILEIYW